jgi:hypothetical protein
MKITHEQYFRNHNLSVGQYGELLVKLAFHGKKMADNYKGYDVKGKIAGKPARIEVKSKLAETPTGRATVVHCGDSKFGKEDMTHLVVILVKPCKKHTPVMEEWPSARSCRVSCSCEVPSVEEAWLLSTQQADDLRRRRTKSKYINVNDLGEFKSIKNRLQKAARSFA